MNRFDNPFHDLWITEILNPSEFVKMFSPLVAKHAEDLFGTGNVVVRGRQGSGKSMLLALLNTHTRVAYARSQENYPAPDGYKAFISAGINLTRDNARIVTSRLEELSEEKRKDWAASTFTDYINYVLVQDLLNNVQYLADEQKSDGVLISDFEIKWTSENLEAFVQQVIKSDAWYGYLDDCKSFDDILTRVSSRLLDYRRYFNFNTDELNESVRTSKTDIGEPAAVIADCLRKSNVIPANALVYLRIDQHEELYELEKNSRYGSLFRQIINRAMAMRDGRVAYRIGTRHYAWSEELTVWGSGAHLEHMRDYSTIDIDEILRRHENPKSGNLFSEFANDVFRRRLVTYGFQLNAIKGKSLLNIVFGESLNPKERAKKYVNGRPCLLKFPDEWSSQWKSTLTELWETSPLDAKFGDAWLRQQAQQRSEIYKQTVVPDLPWTHKQYWVKERNEAALIQIASDANEMLIWSGERQLIDLAGWNILAFMTICRSVWAAWLRRTSNEELRQTTLPTIGEQEQVIGVYDASRTWHEKLKEGTLGSQRAAMIAGLGSWFSARLRSDRALSYPGHNGFSLTQVEFESKCFITDLIRLCRDQGDLIESPHTTKLKDAKPRVKWYLNPLLCPYYRIPHIRTKEPIYTHLTQLQSIYDGSQPGSLETDEEDKVNQQKELF